MSLLACTKEYSPCHCPVTSNIMPNDWYPTYPNTGAYSFEISTFTTYQSFNAISLITYCSGEGEVLKTISNPGGRRMTIGQISAIPINAPGIALALYQGDTLNYQPCYDGPVYLGPTDTMTSPVNWTFKIGNFYTSFVDSTSSPTVGDIVAPDTISARSSFTLLTSGQMSGDSVVFVVGTLYKSIHKTLALTSSCTFTSAEMASAGTASSAILNTGTNAALLQVTAYKTFSHTFNGNVCYFIKSASFSKYVILN